MPPIAVRATAEGYYGNKHREPGEVFILTDHMGLQKDELGRLTGQKIIGKAEDAFAKEWMEKVDLDQESLVSAQQEVDLQDKKDMKAAVDAPKNLGTAPMPAGKDSPVAEAGTGSGRAADAAPVKALGDPGKAL